MKKLWLLLLLPALAAAQNTVTVTATKIHDGTPTGLLSAGTILFQATNSSGQNISYQIGGSGASINSPTICAITNGIITGPACLLADVTKAAPQNFCFSVTIKNTSNVVVLGGSGSGYQCVQPMANSSWCSVGTCNFDNFSPTIPNQVFIINMPPPTATTLGGIYAISCGINLAVRGYDTTGKPICISVGGGGGGSSLWGTITGTLSNQTDLYTYLTSLAPLNSPVLVGVPTVPTPALSDNSQAIINTNWIQLKAFAPLNSPALTGTPTAPTPPTVDSTTKIATTAWVNAQGYGISTGNVAGPGSSVIGHAALFNNTSGTLLSDAGFGFPLDPSHIGTFAAGSNGLAASATIDATNASNISGGILSGARLPNPSSTVLGGIKSSAGPLHQFVTGLSTTGDLLTAQPSCSDLSNASPSCSTDTTNASNIIGGTLAAGRVGTGYPLNFVGAPTASWGTFGSPINLGLNQIFLSMGDYGTSPPANGGGVNFTDSSTSSTDSVPNVIIKNGTTSHHPPLAVISNGANQLQVCLTSSGTSMVVEGSGINCLNLNTSPISKIWEMGSSPAATISTILNVSAAQTSTTLRLHSVTAAGAGFKFWTACTGASPVDGSCTNVVASLDGAGNLVAASYNGIAPTDIVRKSVSNTYSADTIQTFPVSGSTASLVLGGTTVDPFSNLQPFALWGNYLSLNNAAHIHFSPDGTTVQALLDNADTPANMANGVTGTGKTALQNSPSFITPNLNDFLATSGTWALNTGDWMDLQPGLGLIVTGSVTSGTFTANEAIKQTTTNATSTLIGTVLGSANMLIATVVGAANSSNTWVGQSSAAVYTPTAAPATPYIQGQPQSGHLKTGYGSDGRYQLSNGVLAYSDIITRLDYSGNGTKAQSTTATSTTNHHLTEYDGAANTADSGLGNAFSGSNGWIPVVRNVVNQTGLTASLGTTTILTSAPVGQYEVSMYMNEVPTLCSDVTAGSVVGKVIYTDSQAAITKTLATLSFTASGNSNQQNVATFWNNATNNISVATTYTACTTGTGTYDAHFTLTRVQ